MSTTSNTPQNETVQEIPQQAVQKISDNYFTQVKSELEGALQSGEVLTNKNLIDEIKKRNKTNLFDYVKDFIQAPKEAWDWIKTSFMMSFAKSWMGEMFGFTEKLNKKKEEIMEFIKNPMTILGGIMGIFSGYKIFKFITKGKIPGSGMIKTGFKAIGLIGGAGLRVASFGAVAYGAYRLYEFFTENPEEAKSMPESKEGRMKWWSEKLDKIGLKEEKEKLMILLMGEQKANEMFADLENYDPANDPELLAKQAEIDRKLQERIGKYGKLVPLSQKFHEAKEQASYYIEDIISWIKENPAKVAGLTYFAYQIDFLKSLTIGVSKLTAKTLFILASLPIKGASKFPITTIFAIMGIIKGVEAGGEIRVPEDNEQFKLFLKDSINNTANSAWEGTKTIANKGAQTIKDISDPSIEALGNFSLKTRSLLEEHSAEIDVEKIDQAINTLNDKNAIAEMFASISDIPESLFNKGVDFARLTPEEKIKNKNNYGLDRTLSRFKKIFRGEDNNELVTKMTSIMEKFKKEGNLSKSDLDELKTVAIQYRIDIVLNNGYYQWTRLGALDSDDPMEILEGPNKFYIDPTLSKEEQKEKANKYYYDTSGSQAFEVGTKTFTDSMQEEANAIFEKVENGDGYVYAIGSELVYLAAEGGIETVIGPIEIWWNFFASEEKGVNYSAAAIEWGEGILPIFIFSLGSGIATTLANRSKLGLKSALAKGGRKMIGNTLFYPFKPFTMVAQGGYWAARKVVIPSLLGNKKYAEINMKYNPAKLALLDHYNKFWSFTYSQRVRFGYGKETGSIFGDISTKNLDIIKYRKAMMLLHEANNPSILSSEADKRKLRKQAVDLLDDVSEGGADADLKEKMNNPEKFGDAIPELEQKVTELENKIYNNKQRIEVIKEKGYMEKAQSHITEAEKVKKTNPEKAERLYQKAEEALDNAGFEGEKINEADVRTTKGQTKLEIQIEHHKNTIATLETSKTKVDLGLATTATAVQQPNSPTQTPENNTKIDEIEEENRKFNDLPEEEKAKRILQEDENFVRELNEYKKKRKTWLQKAGFKKESLTHSEEILKMDREAKESLEAMYQRRIDLTELTHKTHPNFDFKKHKIQIDEDVMVSFGLSTKINNPEIKAKGALDHAIKEGDIHVPKEFGGRGLMILGVIGASFLAGELARENTEERDITEAFKNEKEKSSNEEKKNDENERQSIEIIKEVLDEYKNEYGAFLSSINSPTAYSDYMNQNPGTTKAPEGLVDLRSIKNPNPFLASDKIITYVNTFTAKHKKMTAEIMMIMTSQHEIINKAFKNSETLQKDGVPIVDALLKIKWDSEKETAYLQYANEEDFIDFSYQCIDSVLQNEKYDGMELANKELVIKDNMKLKLGKDVTEEIGGNFVPFYGSGRDLHRASINYYRGNWKGYRRDMFYGSTGILIDTVSAGQGGKFMKGVNIATDAGEPLYNLGSTALNQGETYENKYYAFSPENAQDIPFDAPGAIRMPKQELEKYDFEKFKNEVDARIFTYISSCYWKNANFEIIDINTIKIFRVTSDNEIIIKRSEDGTWNLDGELAADDGYTFEQAFAMANLSNKTMEWLEKENMEGGSENPFEEDDGNIEFDREFEASEIDIEFDWKKSLTPTDAFKGSSVGQNLIYLKKGNWIDFYKMSFNIPSHWIVNMLNRTYKKHKNKHSIYGQIEKLKNKYNQ